MTPASIHDHPDRRGVWIRPWIIDLVDGDHAAALLLSQLLWWHQPSEVGKHKLRFERGGERWLTRLDEDWWPECRLNARQVRRIRKLLRGAGLIHHKVFRLDGSTISGWRPNLEAIQEAVESREIEGAPEFEDAPVDTPRLTLKRKSEASSRVAPEGKSHRSSAEASVLWNDAQASVPSSSKRGSTNNQENTLVREFERWWAVYPDHHAKADAEKAWRLALRRVGGDVERLLAAAVRFRDDPNRTPAFTPYPAKWLKGDRWEDDPLPSRLIRPAANGHGPTTTQGVAALAEYRQLRDGGV